MLHLRTKTSVEAPGGLSTFLPIQRGHGHWPMDQPCKPDATTKRLPTADASGCHQEARPAHASPTPMTWALARRFKRLPESSLRRDCLRVACHATGQPGTHDGGFSDAPAELALAAPFDRVSDIGDLPRPLRRLGSVGPPSLPRPGALPEPTRAGASCAATSAGTAMTLRRATATSKRGAGRRCPTPITIPYAPQDARRRSGCHTTWGFLERQEQGPSSKLEGHRLTSVTSASLAVARRRRPSPDARCPNDGNSDFLRRPRPRSAISLFRHSNCERARARSLSKRHVHQLPRARRQERVAPGAASSLLARRGGVDPKTRGTAHGSGAPPRSARRVHRLPRRCNSRLLPAVPITIFRQSATLHPLPRTSTGDLED